MLRAHSPGLIGAVGFISLDIQDPRCFENSRHPITEAGIGHMIDVYGRRWEFESRLNRTQVQVAEYVYNKRPCFRVETRHPDNPGKQFHFYRSVVYFDRENRLPIRAENYDWPHSASEPNGLFLESYSFGYFAIA